MSIILPQILILIRGLPGSGKSTLAKSLYPSMIHLEADQYFVTSEGYKFDPSQISAAHKWCINETRNSLIAKKSVVVSNTFTRKWEMQPYLDMARVLNIPTYVMVATGNYQNIHNVSQKVIDNMRARWED